ncbi:unnamed protein product [Calypogeia fissa]
MRGVERSSDSASINNKNVKNINGNNNNNSNISSSKSVPLYLNVYDLTPMNDYLYWFGLGIFHSAVEAHGTEYAFGAHEQSSSGVFEVEPKKCPGFSFRSSIKIGTTDMTSQEFRTFIENCADDYNGDTYHLIVKNCNHFTNDVCYRLTGKDIPAWVNRLARIGWFCNCLLPKDLQVTSEREATESHSSYEGPEQELKHSLGPSLSNKNAHESSRNKDVIENEDDDQHLLSTLRDDSEIRDYLRGSALSRLRDPETII